MVSLDQLPEGFKGVCKTGFILCKFKLWHNFTSKTPCDIMDNNPKPQILSDSELLDLEAFDVIEEDPCDASAAELGLDMLDLWLRNLEDELSGNTIDKDLDNSELQVSQ